MGIITEVSNMFSWTFVSSFFRNSENMASENSEKMASENSEIRAIENSLKTASENSERMASKNSEKITSDNSGRLVGKTNKEANEIIRNEEIIHGGERITTIRPRRVNGEAMFGTCDYRTDRINVETENGKIVKILGTN